MLGQLAYPKHLHARLGHGVVIFHHTPAYADCPHQHTVPIHVRNHQIVAALLCWKVRNMPITESKVEARAGVTGHNVRYVLAFSLAGVILAFFLLSLYFGLLT